MRQLPPEEMKKIRKLTARAIKMGYNGADIKWKESVLEILWDTCLANEEFTVNDFRDRVVEANIETHDNRAMGGVMASAKSFGWIFPTGEIITSRVGHGTPLQIWRSNLYKKSNAPAKQEKPKKKTKKKRDEEPRMTIKEIRKPDGTWVFVEVPVTNNQI